MPRGQRMHCVYKACDKTEGVDDTGACSSCVVLRDKVQAKVRAGVLGRWLMGPPPGGPIPSERYRRGNGAPCSACEQAISPPQTQYEEIAEEQREYRFHELCHEIWTKDGVP